MGPSASLQRVGLRANAARPAIRDERNNNAEFMLEAIQTDRKAIHNIGSTLKNDPEFMLKAIQANRDAIYGIGNALKGDSTFMLKAIQANYSAIYDISTTLKNDPEFMLAAVKVNRIAIYQIGDILKDDPQFMLSVLGGVFSTDLTSMSERLKNDPEFMLQAIQTNQNAVHYIGDTLKDQSEFMLEAIKENYFALSLIGNTLKDSADFMLSLLEAGYFGLHLASERLKNDADFMLKAIQKDRSGARYISDTLKDDPVFMLSLLREMGYRAVQRLASERLKNDLNFMCAAGKIDRLSWSYAGPTLGKDGELLLSLMGEYPSAVYAADPELCNDENFMLAAARINSFNLYSIGSALREKIYPADPERGLEEEGFLRRVFAILDRENEARKSGATVADLTFQEWHRHPSFVLSPRPLHQREARSASSGSDSGS